MRLLCPGARTGTFYIHAIETTPPRRAPKENSLVHTARLSWAASPIYSPLNLIRPSPADVFDQLFVTHFIESFGNLRGAGPDTAAPVWLNELPSLLASPAPSLAKHSIRAGSMFRYGVFTGDIAIQNEARKWYATALRDLRTSVLSKGTSASHATPFNEDMVCSAVMLSHFETMAGTSLGSWFQHVDGASMMLETLGPQSCRTGFLHSIFRHLRLLTVSPPNF